MKKNLTALISLIIGVVIFGIALMWYWNDSTKPPVKDAPVSTIEDTQPVKTCEGRIDDNGNCVDVKG